MSLVCATFRPSLTDCGRRSAPLKKTSSVSSASKIEDVLCTAPARQIGHLSNVRPITMHFVRTDGACELRVPGPQWPLGA